MWWSTGRERENEREREREREMEEREREIGVETGIEGMCDTAGEGDTKQGVRQWQCRDKTSS